MGGFLKWWYPTTIGFPAKMIILIHFRVFWGYHRLRKHPYHIYIYIYNIYIQSTLIWLLKAQTLKIRTTKGTMSSSSRACFSDGFLDEGRGITGCNIWRQLRLPTFFLWQKWGDGKGMRHIWTDQILNLKGDIWGENFHVVMFHPVNPWYLIHTQTVFSHRKVVITAKASMSNELNSNMKPWTERIPWMNFPLPVNLSNRKKLYDFSYII